VFFFSNISCKADKFLVVID